MVHGWSAGWIGPTDSLPSPSSPSIPDLAAGPAQSDQNGHRVQHNPAGATTALHTVANLARLYHMRHPLWDVHHAQSLLQLVWELCCMWCLWVACSTVLRLAGAGTACGTIPELPKWAPCVVQSFQASHHMQHGCHSSQIAACSTRSSHSRIHAACSTGP